MHKVKQCKAGNAKSSSAIVGSVKGGSAREAGVL